MNSSATSGSPHDAGQRGDAEWFTRDAAVRAGETATPASLFQVGSTGRIVGENR